MQFKIKIIKDKNLKPSHRSLSDVCDLKLNNKQYITGEELAADHLIPIESVLKILDNKKVWPIAKIINRGAASKLHPHGKPLGGRPKTAFDPKQAAQAISDGIEEIYGT